MSDAKQSALRMVATREHLPAAGVTGPAECLRPFGNEGLNSRLARTLPTGAWKVRWRADLPAADVFTAILHSAGRTLVTGRSRWFLFDDKGMQLASEDTAGEDAQIDPPHAAFYVANRYSNIAAYSLSNGHPQYRFRVEGTQDYARTFIDRSGSRIIVASAKRALNPMNPAPVKVSALESYEFLEPAKMDEDQLTSAQQRAIRHYEATRLWTAVHREAIALAFTNTVEYLDRSLNLQHSFSAAFEPQGLSLDEAGRLHMLVQTGGKQGLWLISRDGETLAVALPQPVFQRPPVIGYDHTVYLLGAGHVTAVAESGKVAWTYASPDRVCGAMALPDNRLLVGAGSAVLALDTKGGAITAHELPGESLTLPPVLAASGELLVATQTHLYCLAQ